MQRKLIAVLSFVLLAGASTELARAGCKITDLPCWGPDSQCNIRFRNHTGRESGSGGKEFNQVGAAKTLTIWPRDNRGNGVGVNRLQIVAGQRASLNLDERLAFTEIRIRAHDNIVDNEGDLAITMGCDVVRDVLQGNGVCKIFIHRESGAYYTKYSCDGNSIKGPM